LSISTLRLICFALFAFKTSLLHHILGNTTFTPNLGQHAIVLRKSYLVNCLHVSQILFLPPNKKSPVINTTELNGQKKQILLEAEFLLWKNKVCDRFNDQVQQKVHKRCLSFNAGVDGLEYHSFWRFSRFWFLVSCFLFCVSCSKSDVLFLGSWLL